MERDPGLFTEVSIESVLLDADLFVKYKSPEKAFSLLQESIERSPRSIPLREKFREIAISHKNYTEAARQCLALVNLYITREEFDVAYDRLQEAKLLDPRISVAPGLEAIRRARRPDFDKTRDSSAPVKVRTDVIMAGNLAYVGIFDAIQVIENAKMTGLLLIKSEDHLANVSFNHGKIVDAEANGARGEQAFRIIVEINSGAFEFTIGDEFPIVIHASSNTNFMLDILTQLDTERAEKQGMRNLSFEDM